MDQTRKGLTTPEQLAAMKIELAEASDPQHLAALKKKRVGRIAGNIIFLLLFASLLFCLYQILTVRKAGSVPSVFGYYLYSIQTDSMYPTLPAGSIIVSHIPENASKLNVGDIVTFHNTKGERLTHRVVQVSTDASGKTIYYTKGDNPVNTVDTEKLTPERVEAVFVFKVPLF